MNSAKSDAWWRELDASRHVVRMQSLVQLGKRARAGDAEARKLIGAAWGSEDSYARCLALATVFGSGDGELVLRALRDPSRTVRRRAQKLVAGACSDDQVVTALRQTDGTFVRARMVALLHRAGRCAALDRFFESELAGSEVSNATLDLLAFASREVVEEALKADSGRLSPAGWSRLALRHPRLAKELLDPGSADLDPRQRWLLQLALPSLCRQHPEVALELVHRLLSAGSDPKHWLSQPLQELLRRAPGPTFEVLKSLHQSMRPVAPPGPFGAVRFDSRVHRLDSEQLAYLITHGFGTLTDGLRARRWFLRLSEAQRVLVVDTWLDHGRGSWGGFLFRHVPETDSRRERAYRRWTAAAQNADGIIMPEQLKALPRDLRVLEAQRHLDEVQALAARPEARMAYAQFLPFERAQSELEDRLGHPEGETRGSAVRALFATPAYHRGQLAAVLEAAQKRRFEQDPVRMAMLCALAELPTRCFDKDKLPALGEVFQHAIDAQDLSYETSAAMERLVVRLFRIDAVWAADWLTRLLAVRGMPSMLGLVDGLTPGQVAALAPAIEPLCSAWAKRERAGALLWLARSFGKRLALVPALLAALERLATEQPFVHVATAALELLRRHAPKRFTEVAVELLEADPSTILVPSVAQHVSTRRQDVLDPFLVKRKMRGRFASGRSSWVVHFSSGLGTWSSRQHELQAAALHSLLRDKKRDVPTLRLGLVGLARLGFAPSDVLIKYASDPRPPVREIAVRALSHIDDGSGVPVLVECLGDDRARHAIYALRQSFREMSQSQTVSYLRQVPMKQVTVAKEVVRLLGELGGRQGFEQLLALQRDELHRDVKIALHRALWDHLQQDATWQVFEEGVRDPDWVVASRLAAVPLTRLDEMADARVCGLLVRVLDRPELEARMDLLRRAGGLPVRDEGRSFFSACLRRVDAPSPDEAQAGLQAVLLRMRAEDSEAIERVTQRLCQEPRRIDPIVRGLVQSIGPYSCAHVVTLARSVTRQLGADDHLAARAMDLAGSVYDEEQLASHICAAGARGLLHFDVITAAVAAVARSVRPWALEKRLRSSELPAVRRVALAGLVCASAGERGWTEERRALLRAYCADPSVSVAGAARFVFPPDPASETPAAS